MRLDGWDPRKSRTPASTTVVLAAICPWPLGTSGISDYRQPESVYGRYWVGSIMNVICSRPREYFCWNGHAPLLLRLARRNMDVSPTCNAKGGPEDARAIIGLF